MTAAVAPIEDPQEKERKKRRRQSLQLILGGAGTAALGNAVLSGADARTMRDMSGIGRGFEKSLGSNPSTDQMGQVIRAYGEAGHSALNTRVLGMTGRKVIQGIRSLPGMPDGARWKGPESANHYDAFNRGPLYGYLQFLSERVDGGNEGQPGLYNLVDPKSLPGFLQGAAKSINNQRRHRFVSGLMDRTNEAAREVSGRDAVRETDGQHITHTLAGIGQSPALSLAQQRQVLDRMGNSAEFTKWSPFFRKKYDEALRKSYHGALVSFPKYGDTIGGPIVNTRNALIGGGLALGAAGVGIGIHQWLKTRRAKREREKSLALRPPNL